MQSEPLGLCDAIFRALPLIGPDEQVVVGLPDTIWFPDDGLRALPDDAFSFLLFPVDDPRALRCRADDREGRVQAIEVKPPDPSSAGSGVRSSCPAGCCTRCMICGEARERRDEFIGTLVNAWLAQGGEALGVRAGTEYVDVGTLHGYREAMHLLEARGETHGLGRKRRAGRRGDDRPRDRIRRQAAALGPWFHNIDLCGVCKPRRTISWATIRW